ncbi:hypothetical protein KI387_023366, partial [Taxus chinensis]
RGVKGVAVLASPLPSPQARVPFHDRGSSCFLARFRCPLMPTITSCPNRDMRQQTGFRSPGQGIQLNG